MARYSSPIQRVSTDEHGNIAEELPCISCGYNLFSMSTENICPECGVAVGRSVMGDYLKYCNPKWVSKLSIGTNMVVIGVFIFIVVFVLGIAMVSSGTGMGRQASASTGIALAVVLLIARLLLVIGYFFLTAPDPVKSSGGTRARFLARWFLFGTFLFEIGQAASIAGRNLDLYMALNYGRLITMLVGLFALLVFCRQLAKRVPDDSLATHTSIVMWGWAIVLVTSFAIALVPLASSRTSESLTGGLSCMFGLFVIVLVIWSLVLTMWYGRAFTTAAKEARSGWARQLTV